MPSWWSYGGNPASEDKDAVRFLVQDTDEARPLASDDEIWWALSQEANVYLAAAVVLDAVSHRTAGLTAETVGDLELRYGSEGITGRIASLRARGRAYQRPSAGGVSVAEKLAGTANTDVPAPAFSVGMHDNPGAVA